VAGVIAQLERFAAGDELADHVLGGVDEAAAVVAKVEDDPPLARQAVLEGLVKVRRGRVAEAVDPDVEDARLKLRRAH